MSTAHRGVYDRSLARESIARGTSLIACPAESMRSAAADQRSESSADSTPSKELALAHGELALAHGGLALAYGELAALRERLRSPRHRIADSVAHAIQAVPIVWPLVSAITEMVLRWEAKDSEGAHLARRESWRLIDRRRNHRRLQRGGCDCTGRHPRHSAGRAGLSSRQRLHGPHGRQSASICRSGGAERRDFHAGRIGAGSVFMAEHSR